MTHRTRAIVPVHLFGNLAPVDELSELGVPVLEDAAQAIGRGARGGTDRVARPRRDVLVLPVEEPPLPGRRRRDRDRRRRGGRARRRLRFHGSTDKVTYTEVGYNSRLDELQAAVLRVLLPELDGWNDARARPRARTSGGGIGEHARAAR